MDDVEIQAWDGYGHSTFGTAKGRGMMERLTENVYRDEKGVIFLKTPQGADIPIRNPASDELAIALKDEREKVKRLVDFVREFSEHDYLTPSDARRLLREVGEREEEG